MEFIQKISPVWKHASKDEKAAEHPFILRSGLWRILLFALHPQCLQEMKASLAFFSPAQPVRWAWPLTCSAAVLQNGSSEHSDICSWDHFKPKPASIHLESHKWQPTACMASPNATQLHLWFSAVIQCSQHDETIHKVTLASGCVVIHSWLKYTSRTLDCAGVHLLLNHRCILVIKDRRHSKSITFLPYYAEHFREIDILMHACENALNKNHLCVTIDFIEVLIDNNSMVWELSFTCDVLLNVFKTTIFLMPK